MERLLILLCAMVPSIALLQYGIVKARAAWGDRLIWETFCTGGLCAAVVMLPELLIRKTLGVNTMMPWHAAATEAFFVAAVPEELIKLGALLYIITRYGDRTARYDVILLSLATALGFAAIENLMYLISPAAWPLRAFGRAVTAVPAHGLIGLAMGACLTGAGLYPRNRNLWFSAAIIVPILIHAGYDFPLLLVARNHALSGVLPAWLLIWVLTGICIIYLCNKIWASLYCSAQA